MVHGLEHWDDESFERILLLHTQQLKRETGNVYDSLGTDKQIWCEPPRKALSIPLDKMPAGVRVNIVKWLVGDVCTHKMCDCGEETSRRHGLLCSGAYQQLTQHFPTRETEFNALMTVTGNRRTTLLDYILLQNKNQTQLLFYQQLAAVISLVYTNCYGYAQKPNGFWELRENNV